MKLEKTPDVIRDETYTFLSINRNVNNNDCSTSLWVMGYIHITLAKSVR